MIRNIAVILITFLCAIPARACDVPVFRYALERWPVERYRLTISGLAELSAQQNQALNQLRELAARTEIPVNLETPVFDTLRSGSPALELTCPLAADRPVIVWTGSLTPQNARRIAESPLRRKIADRLTAGQSAVWLLLESGDQRLDGPAASLLEDELKELEQSLTLPEPISGLNVEDLPELRVEFSLLRISRADPEEEVLVRMLCASEPDLGKYSGRPIAFPVFGRGRVLYALVGEGINRENVRAACAFLVGPCACEIKDLSPGMDLLIAADWERAIEESWVDKVNATPLASLAGMAEELTAPAERRSALKRGMGRLGFNVLITIAGVLSVLGILTFMILRISGRRER